MGEVSPLGLRCLELALAKDTPPRLEESASGFRIESESEWSSPDRVTSGGGWDARSAAPPPVEKEKLPATILPRGFPQRRTLIEPISMYVTWDGDGDGNEVGGRGVV